MRTRQQSIERQGVFFVLVNAALNGLFPILIYEGVHRQLPPLLFAALSSFVAGIALLFFAYYKKFFGNSSGVRPMAHRGSAAWPIMRCQNLPLQLY